MKKLKLADWAAVAEIVGTIAVVVSLAIVVVSIRQNTAVIQATNDNFLYELTDAWYSDIASNSNLSSVWLKFRSRESVTEAEEHQVYAQVMRYLNAIELAHARFNDGLMPENQWNMWSNGFRLWVREYLPRDYWEEFRADFGEEFAEYVEAIYKLE